MKFVVWARIRSHFENQFVNLSMDSLSSISPAAVLPPTYSLSRSSHHHRCRRISARSCCRSFRVSCRPTRSSGLTTSLERSRNKLTVCCRYGDLGDRWEREGGTGDDEVERALRLDGSIPGSSNEFVEQVSSRAYDMRRNLHQSLDSSSYDGGLSSSSLASSLKHPSHLPC